MTLPTDAQIVKSFMELNIKFCKTVSIKNLKKKIYEL